VTGTTEFDDIGDVVVGIRTEAPNPRRDPAASPLARHPILSTQRRTRVEVSSPAPTTLPSVHDPITTPATVR
jgi:hypothetical protein